MIEQQHGVLRYLFFCVLVNYFRSSDAWSIMRNDHNFSSQRLGRNLEAVDGNESAFCSRRSLFQHTGSFGILLVRSGVSTIMAPAICQAEENDAFEMLDSISADMTSVNPFTNDPKTDIDSKRDSPESSEASRTSNAPTLTSDLEKALKESQRRKTIDPRTHG
jgi:hypothetical protein